MAKNTHHGESSPLNRSRRAVPLDQIVLHTAAPFGVMYPVTPNWTPAIDQVQRLVARALGARALRPKQNVYSLTLRETQPHKGNRGALKQGIVQAIDTEARGYNLRFGNLIALPHPIPGISERIIAAQSLEEDSLPNQTRAIAASLLDLPSSSSNLAHLHDVRAFIPLASTATRGLVALQEQIDRQLADYRFGPIGVTTVVFPESLQV